MNVYATRYALLRDRKEWEASMNSGLALQPDGNLMLTSIARPDSPVTLPPPYGVAPSGVTCAPCASRFVADTAAGQIVYWDGLCATGLLLPAGAGAGAGSGLGAFNAPRGLAFLPGSGLYVADSGNARVVLLADPSLQPVAVLTGNFTAPTALALDSAARLVVVDGPTGRIVRFLENGAADVPYNLTLSALTAGGLAAAFVTCDDADTLYVATQNGALRRIAADGTEMPPLPALDAALSAGALAFDGAHLYVADNKTGRIALVDADSGATVALLPDFIGPVTALAVCTSGELWIKTGNDQTLVHCSAGSAYASTGRLQAGPLDAGVDDKWFMVGIDAAVPINTKATISIYAADNPSPDPGAGDWIDLPSSTGLIGNLFADSGRYLWVRITLLSSDGKASPKLQQVRAETPGENYLDELPGMYQRDDLDGTLAKMLAQFRAQFDRSERILDSLPSRLSIDFAHDRDLPWLAGWLGFELPAGLSIVEQRALLHRVVALYDRRATRFGVAEFVHVYTGVRPRIIEAFAERRIWQLDISSTLGFDTALAPENPLGMVVSDVDRLSTTDPAYGCAEPARLTIGSIIVGAGGPVAAANIGAPLFDETAHRFRVMVPAWQAPESALQDAIRDVLDAEKPAHTAYDLCFFDAAMRVGMQASIGVDTVVAAPPSAGSLAGLTLGSNSYLTPIDDKGRIGSQSQLGVTTLLA